MKFNASNSLRKGFAGAGVPTAFTSSHRDRDLSTYLSDPDLDDGPLLDLLEPGLEAHLVLLPEQDLLHLLPHALETLTLEAVLRLEPEDVVSEAGPVGPRDLAGLQDEDLGLDVLGELAALERSQVAAVLRAGVLGVLPRELNEVGALHQLRPNHVGPDPGRLPRGVRGIGRRDLDWPRVIAQARLELLLVLGDVLIDLGVGHRDAQCDLAPHDLVDP